jgi:hypothetical protein
LRCLPLVAADVLFTSSPSSSSTAAARFFFLFSFPFFLYLVRQRPSQDTWTFATSQHYFVPFFQPGQSLEPLLQQPLALLPFERGDSYLLVHLFYKPRIYVWRLSCLKSTYLVSAPVYPLVLSTFCFFPSPLLPEASAFTPFVVVVFFPVGPCINVAPNSIQRHTSQVSRTCPLNTLGRQSFPHTRLPPFHQIRPYAQTIMEDDDSNPPRKNVRSEMAQYFPQWTHESTIGDRRATTELTYDGSGPFGGVEFLIGCNWVLRPAGLRRFFELYREEAKVTIPTSLCPLSPSLIHFSYYYPFSSFSSYINVMLNHVRSGRTSHVRCGQFLFSSSLPSRQSSRDHVSSQDDCGRHIKRWRDARSY